MMLMLIIVDGFIRWPQTPTPKIDQSRNVTGTLHKFSDILHRPCQSELLKTGGAGGIQSKSLVISLPSEWMLWLV